MPRDYSIADLFGPSPARPEHQDFWTLSQIVLDLDASMTEGLNAGKEVDDVIAENAAKVGDDYSICYLAVQRAMRIFNVKTMKDLLQHSNEVNMAAVIYMEAMIVGARFAKEKA